jgi:hypothetical protein
MTNPDLPSDDTSGPRVTLLEPAPGATFPRGEPVTMRAEVTDEGSGVGYVEFLDGATDIEACFQPGGVPNVTVEHEIHGLEPGTHRLEVQALDAEGNAGFFSKRNVTITVHDLPTGVDLTPYGICRMPNDPAFGQTVAVVAATRNIGSEQAPAGALATWDRDEPSLPAGGPGDLEASAPEVPPEATVHVELGTYVYNGGQELSALRIDRLETVAELDETNGQWPLTFGEWPHCHGGDPVRNLHVSKSSADDELILSWSPTSDPCHAAYRVFESTTAGPSEGEGQFPVDPDFRDISFDDLDDDPANAELRIPMPSGERFYLVVSEAGTRHSGEVEHYGE